MSRPSSAWEKPPQTRAPDSPPVGLGDPWAARPKAVIPVEVKPSAPKPFLRRTPSSQDGLLVAAIVLSLMLHAMVAGTIVLANVVDKLWGHTKPEEPPVMEIVDLSEFPDLAAQVKQMAIIPGVNAPAEPVPPPPDEKGQIVGLAKPAQPEIAPDDTKYLAEHARRAKEETQARELGVTPVLADEFKGLGDKTGQGTDRFAGDTKEDRAVIGPEKGENGESGDAANPDDGKSVREMVERDPFGILAKRPMVAPTPPRAAGLPGRPGGAIDQSGTGVEVAMAGAPNADYLPHVRKGDKTQLNAKEFVFASFWHRLQNQVYPFWTKHVHSANPGQIQKRDYTTRANLILAADGSLIAVDIVQSCGVPAWDRAVTQAFQDAAPFLNPPAGLVGPDGNIRMEDLGFTVSLTGGQVVHMYGDPRAGKLFPGMNEGR